jgi:hypothetical protein
MASLPENTHLLHIMFSGLYMDDKSEINPDIPLEQQEGGLMDFRRNMISVRKKKNRKVFGVSLIFTCNKTADIAGELDVNRWCSSKNAENIAKGYLVYVFEQYIKGSAKWVGENKLYFELNNEDDSLTKDYIIDWLKDDSLEDGPYEGGIGDFWVVPASEFK